MLASRVWLLGVAALAAVVAAVLPARAAAGGRLLRFDGCPAFLGYAKAHARPFVSAYGLGTSTGAGPTLPGSAPSPTRVGSEALSPAVAAGSASASSQAPQQGVDYSGTNVQEQGVDEPDIVKTNGTTLFAIENGELESVDLSNPREPKLLDTLPLPVGWSHELLLYGDHLLVLSRGGYWLEPLPAEPAEMIFPPEPASSTLTEIDVSNPADLTVIGTETLDGSYLDARMVGSSVRIVTSTPMPIALPYATPAAPTASAEAGAAARNRALVAGSRASSWLPTYRLGNGRTRALVSCRAIYRPVGFAGLGMLTVMTIDLSQGLTPLDTTSIMTDGRIVYASPTTLFVADEGWADRPLPDDPEQAPSGVVTQISAFDISDPTRTVYLGSGTVPGYLLDQWSMSEYQGVLRVVSTDTPAWWGAGPVSQSYLTTLQVQNGSLVQLGQVGGLGEGERVYAVRMLGGVGYVATFQQVDPLYTIDLTDPAAPRVMGAVDIPGYSAYLQPIGSNLLLGVGQGVDPTTNEPTGTQVSLFDVSDLAHPKLVASDALGEGWSAVESDTHAFLYWPATGLVVIPFGQEAVALGVSASGALSELGRIVQNEAQSATLPDIDRAVVDGSALLSVSAAGVGANDLTSLASLGWAAFPAPVETPPPPVPLPQPLPVVPTQVTPGIAIGK